MADVEKGKKKKKSSEAAENVSENTGSWRDLIANAGAVLGELDEAAETVKAVSWSEEASGMDFVEATDASSILGDDSGAEPEQSLVEPIETTTFDAQGEEVATETSIENVEIEGEIEGEASLELSEPIEGEETLASFDVEEGMTSAPIEEPHLGGEESIRLTSADDQMGLFDGEGDDSDILMSSDDVAAGLGSMEAAEDESAEDESEVDAAGASDEEIYEETEFVDADQMVSIIESLMFSTDKPISVATIKQLFKGTNVRTKDIMRGVETLMSEYASPQRGVTLEEVHGGYQLRTKVDNAEFMKRMAKVRPFRLSGPALEVMAIVAYKQPITKHEIDEIRGVESGHLLRALMERGLVSFEGKSDLPGKPMTYGSTRKFLETFGLRNLKELPTLSEIEELLPEGIGDVEEEKETLADITDSMSQELVGTYSEGEEELLKINEQLQAVDTTTEFFEQEKQRERERRDRERAQDIRERIVLDDAVEEKDRRWLDRYEAKLAAGTAAEAAASEPGEPADGEALADKLEALTEESSQSAPTEGSTSEDEMEAAADQSWVDDMEDGADDLDVRPDWDEDVEGDKEA
jgi:segregation and condensation protein B